MSLYPAAEIPVAVYLIVDSGLGDFWFTHDPYAYYTLFSSELINGLEFLIQDDHRQPSSFGLNDYRWSVARNPHVSYKLDNNDQPL